MLVFISQSKLMGLKSTILIHYCSQTVNEGGSVSERLFLIRLSQNMCSNQYENFKIYYFPVILFKNIVIERCVQ